jgi:hypothetical protein
MRIVPGSGHHANLPTMVQIRTRLRWHSQCFSQHLRCAGLYKSQGRLQSSARGYKIKQLHTDVMTGSRPALSVMPTRLLLRTLLATSILSSPRLLNTCLPLMTRIANSKSMILNPDKNSFMRGLMRILFYNHFCAGSSDSEVKKTVSTMKEMGFKGVILGYAREVFVDPAATPEEAALSRSATSPENAVDQWREGNLRSLPMIGSGDFLAVK